jgi:spore coat polysaccharide biosynthesis predicted glycosyltransferase SpsG
MIKSPIVLVTSAAPDEGRGHLARTLTLAEALVPSGSRVVAQLLRGAPTPAQLAAFARLGVDVRLGTGPLPSGPGAVVLDLPDPNEAADWASPDRLMVFDDRELLRSPAAIVVQPSMPTWLGAAQAQRVLAGYHWAPVRASIRWLAARSMAPGRADTAPVLICFGGSDPADVTGRLLPAVAAAVTPTGRPLLVIVGPGYGGEARPGEGWAVLRDPPDLDARLAGAGLALIGAGTMKFELAALGVPEILLAVADDQRPTGPPFAATGAARYLGDGRTLDPALVADAVGQLAADAAGRASMAMAGRDAVDGLGADRLASELLALAARAQP